MTFLHVTTAIHCCFVHNVINKRVHHTLPTSLSTSLSTHCLHIVYPSTPQHESTRTLQLIAAYNSPQLIINSRQHLMVDLC